MVARPQPNVEVLMDRLSGVKDPCSIGVGSPIDIVSMGLIEKIDVDDDGVVTVHLVLTQPTCWFFGDMRKHIVDALADVPDVHTVRVEVFEELWSPDRMRRPIGTKR
jgi:metal-sulfur cluster biosynthetic enzyme